MQTESYYGFHQAMSDKYHIILTLIPKKFVLLRCWNILSTTTALGYSKFSNVNDCSLGRLENLAAASFNVWFSCNSGNHNTKEFDKCFPLGNITNLFTSYTYYKCSLIFNNFITMQLYPTVSSYHCWCHVEPWLMLGWPHDNAEHKQI